MWVVFSGPFAWNRLPVDLYEEIENARCEGLGPINKQPVPYSFDDYQL